MTRRLEISTRFFFVGRWRDGPHIYLEKISNLQLLPIMISRSWPARAGLGARARGRVSARQLTRGAAKQHFHCQAECPSQARPIDRDSGLVTRPVDPRGRAAGGLCHSGSGAGPGWGQPGSRPGHELPGHALPNLAAWNRCSVQDEVTVASNSGLKSLKTGRAAPVQLQREIRVPSSLSTANKFHPLKVTVSDSDSEGEHETRARAGAPAQ